MTPSPKIRQPAMLMQVAIIAGSVGIVFFHRLGLYPLAHGLGLQGGKLCLASRRQLSFTMLPLLLIRTRRSIIARVNLINKVHRLLGVLRSIRLVCPLPPIPNPLQTIAVRYLLRDGGVQLGIRMAELVQRPRLPLLEVLAQRLPHGLVLRRRPRQLLLWRHGILVPLVRGPPMRALRRCRRGRLELVLKEELLSDLRLVQHHLSRDRRGHLLLGWEELDRSEIRHSRSNLLWG
mmetsp:Transcript_4546/g.10174  ORF Transcript_4546/g.10174 Transcript_4546/m.10174 type:complete len:234 (+) Transcript_4546:1189-1890(+)